MPTPSSQTPVRLFSADLDGTLLGNTEGARRFKQAWELLGAERRPVFVLNTGRSVAGVRALIRDGTLPAPDYIIGSLGTELCDGRYSPDPNFPRRFRDGWDLARVEAILAELPDIHREPPEFLHPYKSSWYWGNASSGDLERLRTQLQEAGLKTNVIYSAGRHLDVVPAAADKGSALAWLCERLAIPATDVLVAGDTAHDSSMFKLAYVKRIVVGNALPELLADTVGLPKFCATRPMADGVLQGLHHFGVTGHAPRYSRHARHDAAPPPPDLHASP